jgi:hypothetical protein
VVALRDFAGILCRHSEHSGVITATKRLGLGPELLWQMPAEPMARIAWVGEPIREAELSALAVEATTTTKIHANVITRFFESRFSV